MVNDSKFKDDVEILYEEKQDADIYALLDFCDKYNGKLGLKHIPSLLKLLYEDSTVSEQNETIVSMLDTIVEGYGQEAVNIIVQNTDILIEEDSAEELYLILIMILRWNREMKLDIVTPVKASKEPVQALYKDCIKEMESSLNRANETLFQEILAQLSET